MGEGSRHTKTAAGVRGRYDPDYFCSWRPHGAVAGGVGIFETDLAVRRRPADTVSYAVSGYHWETV